MQRTNTYGLYPETSLEIVRLINLDRMTTAEVGGIFAGVAEAELPVLRNILDLGCGPGSWALDVAFAYPECEVAGVDIRRTMVKYAWARARTQRLFNASFGVMDITEPLDFSDRCFDLVNARFLVGALHRSAWVPLIAECMRTLCSGGLFCLIDTDGSIETNSPAFSRLAALMMQALQMGGYTLSSHECAHGTASTLAQLLRQSGFRRIQCVPHAIDVSAGTTAWADFYHNAEILYLQVQPLLLTSGLVKQAEIDRLYLQMLIELQGQDFCGRWPLLTICGMR